VFALPLLDAPALDRALGALAFRDAACVHELAGAEHIGHVVFAAVFEQVQPEVDALADRAAADARLHHVGLFLRDVRQFARDRVGDHPQVVDRTALDDLAERIGVRLEAVFGRQVERAVEFRVELVGPHFGCRLQSVRRVFVGSQGDCPHRWRLDDGHRDRLLHPLTGGVGLVVDHDDVGHAGLVAGKALQRGSAVVVGPRANARDFAGRALARAEAHRAFSWSAWLWHGFTP